MLSRRIAALIVACAVGSFLWGGIASAADGAVVCDNPADPLTCTLVASNPGSDGTNQEGEEGDGGGGAIQPNDGSGSAAEVNAAKAASEAEGGSNSAAPRTVNSTECDWMPLEPSPGPGDPRWEG